VRIDDDNRDEKLPSAPEVFTNMAYDSLGRIKSVQLDGTGSFDPNGGAKLTTVRLRPEQPAHARAPAVGDQRRVTHDVTRLLYDESGSCIA
jgi:hypothetical protein